MVIVVDRIVSSMRRYLRNTIKESYYATSQWSGLRPEVIKKVEHGDGNLQSFKIYINAFCNKYNSESVRIFRDLYYSLAQRTMDFTDGED